ncbi:MAG: hypothetical protein AB4042_21360 [Leptolyngbyaceae cyanobacterium]
MNRKVEEANPNRRADGCYVPMATIALMEHYCYDLESYPYHGGPDTGLDTASGGRDWVVAR